MVVGHLDPGYAVIRPLEHDPPLVIDPDRVRSPTIAPERLEPVPRWHRQISEPHGGVQVLQLTLSRASDVRREPPCRRRAPIVKQILGQPVPKGPDHVGMLPYFDNTDKLTPGP